MDVSEGDRERILALEGRPAGDQFVENCPQRVDVSPPVDLLPFDLLRRHVQRRPHRHPRGGQRREWPPRTHQPGDPEIGNLDPDTLWVSLGNHDIVRFHVAVDDAVLMRAGQRRRNLLRDVLDAIER